MATLYPAPSFSSFLNLSIQDTPLTPCAAYVEMAERWMLLDDLLRGTAWMRERGMDYLPREELETHSDWERRRSRTFLYGALKRAVRRVTEKPFTRDVSLRPGVVPAWIGRLVKSTDPWNRNLTQFARSMFEDAVVHGLTHVLVDAPRVFEYGEGIPRLVHIPAANLFAWRYEGSRLVEIRWFEDATVRDGQWKETTVRYVWVLRPGEWQRFRIEQRDLTPTISPEKIVPDGAGAAPFGDRIPLVTFYTGFLSWMRAEPPFEDLAWTNLAHYQSSSDQRNILHYARIPILHQTGLGEEDAKKPLGLGAGARVVSGDPAAKLEFVEHSGNAIGAGRRDLMDLQDEMEVLGLAPILSRLGFVTATSRVLEQGDNESQIQTWIRGLEWALDEAIRLAGLVQGESVPDDFEVDVFNDFGIVARGSDQARILLESYRDGALSRRTLLTELRRLGQLADGFNLEAELARSPEKMEGKSAGSLEKDGVVRRPSPTRNVRERDEAVVGD